jgi:LacI family transcriptional regulator
MNSRTSPHATITDVARACGVSEATVSYVLNGKRALRPATREKVFRAMRELNYHPSAVARGLSGKRVNTFGVLVGAVDTVEAVTNPYTSGLLVGMMSCARREGFNVTLFTAPWIDARRSASAFRDGRTDGILAVAPPFTTDIVSGLRSLAMPLVVISGASDPEVTDVDVDNYLGVKLAVEHLRELGHRDIAYLMGNGDLACHKPRRNAFCDAYGGPIREGYLVESTFDGALAYEQTRQLLAGPAAPTAIVAGNDSIALGVLAAARDMGICVPEQLSVVGFDDAPCATMTHPNLTTVRQPLNAIGETAAKLLIGAMQEPHTPVTSHLLSPELIVRGTTAAPRVTRRSQVSDP